MQAMTRGFSILLITLTASLAFVSSTHASPFWPFDRNKKEKVSDIQVPRPVPTNVSQKFVAANSKPSPTDAVKQGMKNAWTKTTDVVTLKPFRSPDSKTSHSRSTWHHTPVPTNVKRTTATKSSWLGSLFKPKPKDPPKIETLNDFMRLPRPR
jgi:hypothetical protein